MPKKLELTLACGDYEIIRPLKEGIVQPDGIELNILTKADSATRHWRFLRGNEYDIAEFSASSYIVSAIATCRSARFRSFCIAVSGTASSSSMPRGNHKPTDLIGKKIG